MHLKALRFCSIEHLLKLRRDAPIHLHAVAAVREREAVALGQAAIAIHEGEVPGQIWSRVRRRVCGRIDRHALRPERQCEHDEQNEHEEFAKFAGTRTGHQRTLLSTENNSWAWEMDRLIAAGAGEIC